MDAWQTVVRYDHDPHTDHGHNVTKEGLHIDSYRDREQYRIEFVTRPLQVGVAPEMARQPPSRAAPLTNRSFQQP